MPSLQNQKIRWDCSIAAPQKTTWKQQTLGFQSRFFLIGYFIPCFTHISTSGIFPLILTAQHAKHVRVQHLAILWFRKMLSGQPSWACGTSQRGRRARTIITVLQSVVCWRNPNNFLLKKKVSEPFLLAQNPMFYALILVFSGSTPPQICGFLWLI